MKKKLLSILCILSMVLVMAACGASNDDDDDRPSKKKDKSKDTSVSTELSVDDPAPTSTDVIVADTPVVPEDKEFAPGQNIGNTYTNDYFGIACYLDSNWTLKSQEEILALNQQAANMVSDDYSVLFEMSTAVTDMYALNVNGTDTINITIEKQALNVSEQQVVDQSEPIIADALASMGIENIQTAQTTFSLGNAEHPAIIIEGSFAGIPVYEFVTVIKNGDYMMNISCAAWNEDKLDEFASMFVAIN